MSKDVAAHLLTVAQVADRLSVSQDTVRRLLETREILGSRVRRTVRVDPDSVEAFLERTRIGEPVRERRPPVRPVVQSLVPRCPDWRTVIGEE